MKKKGFTLVELLAVIVILAVILAIAIPAITGIVQKSTRDSLESSLKMVARAADLKLTQNPSYNISNIDASNISTELGVDGSNFSSVDIKKVNGLLYVTVVGQNKWSNLTASGDKNVVTISNSSTSYVNGANKPVLASGMTAVKWNSGTNTWDTVSNPDTDNTWYNYDNTNKMWANAKTADGSFWVWIPRYIYFISSNWHSNTTGTIEVQFSKGVDDNWNKASIGVINTDETANASNNTWTNEPAFTFGSTELTGFWVAKFETTAAEGVANGYTGDGSCAYATDNVTTKTIKIVPNATSWRCISIGNIFTNTRNMETNNTYGWGTSGSGIDTHLMKNTEWGALAYLSKSSYGVGNTEIGINNNNSYTTGCGATAGSSSSSSCNTYNTANGMNASTTGNIYGVYDMSGGAWEYQSTYLNNGNSYLSQGSNIVNADAKYKIVYNAGSTDDQPTNYGLTINQKGDALYETSNNVNGNYSWFNDYAYMTNNVYPWVIRGGAFCDGYGAGAFNSYISWGGYYSYYGFRPVLAVNTGL